ncbi:MAG: methyltransferase domain-containing protein, partial [Pseudomonadota bacterium]
MLTVDDAFKERWYYTVELKPGEFTDGFSFKNIAVTRKALQAVDLKGKTVLDVSTMEGMFSTLAAKRGGRVIATDVIGLEPKVSLLKRLHGVSFDYFPHSPVVDYANHVFSIQASKFFSSTKPLTMETHTPYGFDVVLSSGVIYHVANPVEHLLNYRKLCKLGGVCIIEGACLVSDEIEMIHDHHGDAPAFGGQATWFVSTRALEIYLRSAFFEPLGFAYVTSQGANTSPLVRIAVVARAVSERIFPEEFGDQSKSELYKNMDYKPLYPAAQLTGACHQPPAVDLSGLHAGGDLRGSVVTRTAETSYEDADLTL